MDESQHNPAGDERLVPRSAGRHDEPVSGFGISSLDVANTIIAAAAFAAVAASLVWQAVTWKLEGSRVSAEHDQVPLGGAEAVQTGIPRAYLADRARDLGVPLASAW